MSKHSTLTVEEFSKYTPNERTIHYLETYCNKRNLKREEMNILDWGCGRGREVLWLREQGYNAYGIDIDIEPIRNGIELFKAKGYEDSSLRLLSPDGKTDFPDDFFHFTFSNQVFEHVSNIGSVAAEIGRITIIGGIGFHIYPAHKYIVEGHLFMPLVHWLPKNIIRKYLISAYVVLGKEPYWPQLKDSEFKEKVNTYYQYSISKTFYRRYFYVKKVFQNNGFDVSSEMINNPKVINHKLLGKFTNLPTSDLLINYLLFTFKSVELLIKKL